MILFYLTYREKGSRERMREKREEREEREERER